MMKHENIFTLLLPYPYPVPQGLVIKGARGMFLEQTPELTLMHAGILETLF